MSPGSGSQAAARGTPAKYNANDLVLAKVRGYPPWPGIIVDDENVPKAVLKERRSRDHYIVRFFPAADYHFATARDLSQLTQKQIENYIRDPSKKGGELKDAYKCAGNDPLAWNEEQNDIVRMHENAKLAAEEEEQENEDQLEEEGDEDEEVAPKKRKRDDDGVGKIRESAVDKRKKAKVAKADAAKQASAKPSSHAKKASNGEQEGDEDSDPAVKMVKEWRHKLQRAFLTAKDGLQGEDMPANDETFKLVEAYDDMTLDQLKHSKIGKVMKKIVQLDEIPRDDEFHFKERAEALYNKWQATISRQSEGETKDIPSQDAPAQDEAPAEDKPEPDTTAESTKAEEDVKASTDA
ncbi:uncharacterized protein PFL1_03127 [Pseudozyma flocculosa PF-1]|uniref:PWWP domain-containing protein n=2 Tax=Pseudozyma flocculosa TaxID=84751 RepID=A0A5C3F1G0_9BASI|nr:uncharacterized protein PFL1_03127 [Pseudozyma flocculosa PF-1]EPQ29372.1 hypothetical protein PFL1_03127 [Pseudozyma flocculosa PF-1]SPO37890.1 uncharacterized protein PSFLO_03367 [Pseudozyma flocculosa]